MLKAIYNRLLEAIYDRFESDMWPFETMYRLSKAIHDRSKAIYSRSKAIYDRSKEARGRTRDSIISYHDCLPSLVHLVPCVDPKYVQSGLLPSPSLFFFSSFFLSRFGSFCVCWFVTKSSTFAVRDT